MYTYIHTYYFLKLSNLINNNYISRTCGYVGFGCSWRYLPLQQRYGIRTGTFVSTYCMLQIQWRW